LISKFELPQIIINFIHQAGKRLRHIFFF